MQCITNRRSDGKDDDDDDDNKASAAEAVAALETAGMSARERNRAKREAKRKAAEKANTYRGLPEVEEPAAKRVSGGNCGNCGGCVHVWAKAYVLVTT